LIDFEGYFWLLKSYFPGDADFTIESYSELPYSYVLEAVSKGAASYRTRLHDLERPTALLGAMYANSKKDPKKREKPSTYLDYSFYKPISDKGTPLSHNGSAYMELLKRRMLPPWALFCLKAMQAGASSDYIPKKVALISEDAILLHPRRSGSSYTGLLLALESASEQIRTFTSTEGEVVKLRVPRVETKVVAMEGETLSP